MAGMKVRFMGPEKRRRSITPPKPIDHGSFLQLLTQEFPEVPKAFDECVKGLLHCEMGAFARITEEAMDAGRFWRVEQYFRFVERIRECSTPELENAIDVSFIEYLAFGEATVNRYQAMKRMPHALRQILLEIDGRGRWA